MRGHHATANRFQPGGIGPPKHAGYQAVQAMPAACDAFCGFSAGMLVRYFAKYQPLGLERPVQLYHNQHRFILCPEQVECGPLRFDSPRY